MWILYDKYDVEVNYIPSSPGRLNSEPGDCFPPEKETVEIVQVRFGGRKVEESWWPEFDFKRLGRLCWDRILSDKDGDNPATEGR